MAGYILLLLSFLSFLSYGFFLNLHLRVSYITTLNLQEEQCKAEKKVLRGWCVVLWDVTVNTKELHAVIFSPFKILLPGFSPNRLDFFCCIKEPLPSTKNDTQFWEKNKTKKTYKGKQTEAFKLTLIKIKLKVPASFFFGFLYTNLSRNLKIGKLS